MTVGKLGVPVGWRKGLIDIDYLIRPQLSERPDFLLMACGKK